MSASAAVLPDPRAAAAAAATRPHAPDAGVTAELTYAVRTGSKPVIESAALTGGVPRYLATFEARPVFVRNGRPVADGFTLDRNGFAVRRHRTEVADLYDETAVTEIYYPEIARLLKAETGASRVVIFDHTHRTDGSGVGGARQPARHVHNDYTEWSGAQRIAGLLDGPDREAVSAGARVAQVNVWRPIRGPVQRAPLGVIDATSVDPADFVATDLVYPERTGEIYHLAYNPAHDWVYVPEMQRDEVLLIKGYDTATDGRARFTPHAAFDDPTTPPEAPPRESIEVRTLLLFDQPTGGRA